MAKRAANLPGGLIPGNVLFGPAQQGKRTGDEDRSLRYDQRKGEIVMLYWAIAFLLVAILAGVLGFTEIAGAATVMAQVLFFIFLAMCIIMFIGAIFLKRKIF